jgi:mannose-6-phosphate isomerase-like protein (cupin superfamily)
MRHVLLALGSSLLSTACAPAPTYPPFSPSAVPGSPVQAGFVELGSLELASPGPCDVRFLAVASGHATVARGLEEHPLAEGDTLVMQGVGRVRASGKGVVLAAAYSPERCDEALAAAHRGVTFVRAGAAPELSWGGGTMHARLDVEADRSPGVYFGRLSGSAAVAEHQHDGVREVLCAWEGAGTFTVAGEPHRIGARQCVQIPASTLHSWSPDPGTTLVAFQIYTPPGPEQRFRRLAAGAPVAR